MFLDELDGVFLFQNTVHVICLCCQSDEGITNMARSWLTTTQHRLYSYNRQIWGRKCMKVIEENNKEPNKNTLSRVTSCGTGKTNYNGFP
jgi:hypothetical protein